MPELPEVTTTVRGLQNVLPHLRIVDVWTDLAVKHPIPQFTDTLKSATFFKKFKKIVIGATITHVDRRAKNILIHLSNKMTILIHLKMTGHILYGEYVYTKKKNTWAPNTHERTSLHDPFNRFVHVVFSLSNGKYFVLCDARKFGKVTLLQHDTERESSHLKNIGPEPLDNALTLTKFITRITLRPHTSIKTVLMDQSILAGIGNIYSDEMLWSAGIHPESYSTSIPIPQVKALFTAMKHVLTKGIDFGGDSMSDYRDIDGNPGRFHHHHNVYRKTNTPCSKKGCSGAILRKVINGRSAHYCSVHQKLYRK